MYKTENSVVFTKGYRFYESLLLLYPDSYRKKFGQEMLFIFKDLYQEELTIHGRIGFGFWFSLIADTSQSILVQYLDMIKKQGIKKYFHISSYNIIGGILLLPFLTLLSLDILGRLAQGDLVHYNRAWYAAITQSFLYKEPFSIKFIFIFGPFLAVLLNIVSLLLDTKKTKKLTFSKIIFGNPLAVIIIGLGLLCLLIVYGHDFVPCFFHGFLRVGIFKLPQIILICSNA